MRFSKFVRCLGRSRHSLSSSTEALLFLTVMTVTAPISTPNISPCPGAPAAGCRCGDSFPTDAAQLWQSKCPCSPQQNTPKGPSYTTPNSAQSRPRLLHDKNPEKKANYTMGGYKTVGMVTKTLASLQGLARSQVLCPALSPSLQAQPPTLGSTWPQHGRLCFPSAPTSWLCSLSTTGPASSSLVTSPWLSFNTG